MRLFLVDNGYVIIRNGDTVATFSVSNATKYLPQGIDLSGITYKDYRMDHIPPIHFDDSGQNVAAAGRVEWIESLIDNALAIETACNDAYYGATLEEAREIKLAEIMARVEAYVLQGKPLWYIVATMQEGTAAATAMKTRAINAKNVYLQIKVDVDAAQTTEEVTAITFESYLS